MDVKATSEFRRWIDSLKDLEGRARILVRIDRLAHGNTGSHRVLKCGLRELKIDVGPGYRVYYAQRGNILVLLLGGDKSSQGRDIAKAIRLAKELRE